MKEKVLVGVDDSRSSWNALDYTLSLAKAREFEEVMVVHSETESAEEEFRTGEEILERAKEKAAEEGVEINTKLLVRGLDPEVDIVKFAEEKGYDHIVIGHRGRSGIGEALLGSVAESILENANCIVTTVRTAPYIEKAGKRLKPREIEKVLEEHEGVKRAVILDSDEKAGKKEIVAFYTAAEGYEPAEEMIKNYVEELAEKRKIERVEVPDRFERLEEFPETNAETIDRDKLRKEKL